MNDNTMCIRMENNKFQYAYELPEDYDYEVIQCNTSNDNYLKKKIGKIKNKINIKKGKL
jgi:hypothetical protein